MGRKKTDRVKVVASVRRGVYLLRWRDSDDKWCEQATEIKLGKTDRERLQSRGRAERAAALLAEQLATPHAPETPAGPTLIELLDTWETNMLARKTGAKQITSQLAKVNRCIDALSAVVPADLDAERVTRFLISIGRSNRTYNHYLGALRQFANLFIQKGIFPSNPLQFIPLRDAENDPRHTRRVVTNDEFSRMLTAALAGPPIEAMSGAERAILYLTACWTGFRRKELSELTVGNLHLAGTEPIIWLGNNFTKNHGLAELPLHPVVATHLADWVAFRGFKDRSDRIFDLITKGGYLRKTSWMIEFDLKAAREVWLAEAKDDQAEQEKRTRSEFLTYKNYRGEFADFHAMRHTFISNLARAGVPLAIGQKLARHKDVRLTAKVYTHVEMEQKRLEIGKLPAPPQLTANSKTVA